ncbi:MAG: hypothetical protein KQ78_00209 [Candidatus Izimaplasma bacterium HR2]|nr:MAG: hypothetical protein KQ78_00209 [Candidatus Izimaplasma bacterium HR2]
MIKRKVFISYHHGNDQNYKNELLRLNDIYDIFEDYSVDTGDIDDNLPSEVIRNKIRDLYLQDSTVTILLLGSETKGRKHVDWELYSSMYDGKINKKSGIIIVNLPNANQSMCAFDNEEKQLVSPNSNWIDYTYRSEYEKVFPFMPSRIIDNMVANIPMAVVNWNRISSDIGILKALINKSHVRRKSCNYDLSSPMRRNNAKRI